MDYALRTRYLARAFFDAHSWELPPSDREDLLKQLSIEGLEYVPAAELIGAEAVARPGFVSRAADLRIMVRGESVDLTAGLVRDEATRDEDFRKFCAMAAVKLAIVCEFAGRVPHRLASIEEGLLEAYESAKLEAIGRAVLRPPSELVEPPIEWDWRYARRKHANLGGRDEPVNEILSIKRLVGTLHRPASQIPLDRILVELDYNTAPLSTRGRFNAKAMEEFFAASSESHHALSDVVRGIVANA